MGERELGGEESRPVLRMGRAAQQPARRRLGQAVGEAERKPMRQQDGKAKAAVIEPAP
jgi:hypothetical protein